MKQIAIIMTFILLSSATAVGGEGILKPIPEDKIEYGCGCSYGYRLENSKQFKFIFQSDLGYRSPKAYISGKLVNLEPVKIDDIPKEPKVGDTFEQHYKYEDIDIKFFNTVTFVCPKGSESCEVIRFKSKLETTKEGKIEVSYAAGDCGC